MAYFVVNVRNSRGKVTSRATHIMESKSASTPGIGAAVVPVGILALALGGGPKLTLCGQAAGRHVGVFDPSEVSCRECKRRWQLRTQTISSSGRTTSTASRRDTSSREGNVSSIKAEAPESKSGTTAQDRLAEETGAIAIWVVAANISAGDKERYKKGWNALTEDDRQRYRGMARACIVAYNHIGRSK